MPLDSNATLSTNNSFLPVFRVGRPRSGSISLFYDLLKLIMTRVILAPNDLLTPFDSRARTFRLNTYCHAHTRKKNKPEDYFQTFLKSEKIKSFPAVVFELQNQLHSIPDFLLEFFDKSDEQFQGKLLRHFHQFLLKTDFKFLGNQPIYFT